MVPSWVHDFNDGGAGLEAGEAAEIDGAFGLAGAFEDAAGAGAEGEDVAGAGEVGRVWWPGRSGGGWWRRVRGRRRRW